MKHSIGKIIGGSVIGLLAGLIGMIMLMTANPMSGVVGAWLYAWAGPVPAGVFALAGLYIAHLLGGGVIAGSFALAVLVPMAVAIGCIRKKMAYKKCMAVSIGVQTGAAVLALALVWASTRTDLVELLMTQMRTATSVLPYEALNAMFNPNAASGGFLSAQQLSKALDEYLVSMDAIFRIGLPGMLLSNCLLGGVLNVAVPVWVWARRGDETGIRRVPVSEWRIPESAAIGMPICMVLGIVLDHAGLQGGDSVNFAVQMLFQTMLQIQCMGAFSRLAKKSGASMFMRGLLVVGAVTFASQIAVYLGAFSLYMGSKGLISTYIRNRKKNREGDE